MSQPFSADYLPRDSATSRSTEVSAWGLLRLRKQLEQGLPLTPRPFQTLAERTGLSEQEVMDAITQWQSDGLIKRFGLVVKHRTLGYNANAMVVWNIPDEQVQALGKAMAAVPFITLCYQRPRRLPDWPYNLFCMIHGTNRERVLAQLACLIDDQNLQHIQHAVLFSNKAYRQRGGRYVSHD
ncbi:MULTISPECIES: AsnC family protein [unclassified Marinobacter]|uniref:siroheme decarboxylase subunit beta n=1 Tax=unclassified Marinobacter TaxID=83889 RepID=UPI0026E1D4F2|nr:MULTISPECIES: AsnC family protein [unclassified Marinobacter]MDO6443043.1 AsnC family protein [Marinobacter sp. 2_MG-2023]MDO6822742.1 AsnC family protein [Marinobacter sp. 1_MG-2023]